MGVLGSSSTADDVLAASKASLSGKTAIVTGAGQDGRVDCACYGNSLTGLDTAHQVADGELQG